jgi:RND family efflux transporter MFP subunit
MKRKWLLAGLALVGAAGLAFAATGTNPVRLAEKVAGKALGSEAKVDTPKDVVPPAVSVVKADVADFTETVLVTGSLVPRLEILVAPEIEGFRVLDLKVEEGDRVEQGDVLATLAHESLDAQLAQNEAQLARTTAAIAQARSLISQAEARLEEARAAFERAKPLKQSGHISESVFDQREAAARTAQALLVSARDGLRVSEAEKAAVEAQRRELAWKRGRTEVRAPASGIVSRRNARVGAVASAVGDPMFRIIANGEIELDAEVPEADLARIAERQPARVTVAGSIEATGKVRLVSPEVDRATRLGRVRVFLGENPNLHVGAFGRGVIETTQARGLAVPLSAVMYGPSGPYVLTVAEDIVARRAVRLGLTTDGKIEVREGLPAGALVVAKAGTFLREGDRVRPVLEAPGARLSEVRR